MSTVARLSGPPEWELSDRIRRVRRSMHMEQREFAALLKISSSALSGYETGRFKPDDVVWFAQIMEEATGVPAVWILGLAGDAAIGRRRRPVTGPARIPEDRRRSSLGSGWLRHGVSLPTVTAA